MNEQLILPLKKTSFTFKAYDYLVANKIKRKQITEFIESGTAVGLGNLVDDLEGYIKGGKKNEYLREAYGHLGKPRARKIKDYVYSILKDAWTYELFKRPVERKGLNNISSNIGGWFPK